MAFPCVMNVMIVMKANGGHEGHEGNEGYEGHGTWHMIKHDDGASQGPLEAIFRFLNEWLIFI